MSKLYLHLKLPIGGPCEAFGGILDSPPGRLSREGGTQRRCCPATLLLLLFALVFNCGCVLCTFVPPEFEGPKWEAIMQKIYYLY
jgi:hypothetical protein